MAHVLANRVKESTATTGTGAVTLLGAATGYQSFAAVGNANTCYYTIAHQSLSEWEVGVGTYTAGTTSLSRATVIASSNAGALVNFSTGIKDVFVTAPTPQLLAARPDNKTNLPGSLLFPDATEQTSAAWVVPSGTAMLFKQTAAPTGWTKSTAHDNKALRVVSGTAGSGGTTGFTSVFTSRTPTGSVSVGGTVGGTTLSESQMPSHTHAVYAVATADGNSHSFWSTAYSVRGFAGIVNGSGGSGYLYRDVRNTGTQLVQNTGGAGAHNHSFSGSGSLSMNSMDFSVQYVDVIIATKD